MKYTIIHTFDPVGFVGNELQEKSSKLVLRDWLKYPNNSIEHRRVYNLLLDKIDLVPIKELEEFLNKYN
ncbi:MAG: hypothetical protein ACJAVA_000184 [Flavobacteriaceae bacterium]|jgi:hypothetical protein